MSRDRGYRLGVTFVLLLALALVSVPLGTSEASAASSPPPAGWLQTGPMPAATGLPYAAVKLYDGRVLAESFNAGNGQRVARATIYDPVTNSWTQTSPTQLTNGYGAAVTLASGEVLFTGGFVGVENAPSSLSAIRASQIYNPQTNRWKSIAPMLQAHAEHSAILLQNGRVLVFGGVQYAMYGVSSDVELYNQSTNVWTKVGSEIDPRVTQMTVLLHGDRVMVIGGVDGEGHGLASAEIFDPMTNSWSQAAPMPTPREDGTATTLSDGRVLVAGGTDGTGQPLASTEIYHPETNSWSAGPPMTTPRKDQAAVWLPSGEVLVAGGVGLDRPDTGDLALTSSEIFHPTTTSWSDGPDLPVPIGYPSGVFLVRANVQALVLGAANLNGAASRGLLYTTHYGGQTGQQQPPGGPLPANRVYFTQTGHYLADGFLAYWQHFGGLATFGYPISEEFQQNGITVQYFERARFEWHPGSNPARYDVELGLLGDQAAQAQGLLTTQPFRPVEAASDANCTFDAVTEHRLCFGFRAYWQANGGLAIFGHPISEEFRDPATGLTVQYFERAVFEYHPYNPAPYRVLLRRLGTGALAGR